MKQTDTTNIKTEEVSPLTVKAPQVKRSLFIARHGETEWNKLKRYQGSMDSALTEVGVAQAKNIVRALEGRSIKMMYSSPLGRALQTARIISQGLGIPCETIECFRELSYGQFEGRSKDEVKAHRFFVEREKDRLHSACPGGESYFEAALRVQQQVDRIVSSPEDALIVGHTGVNRMIRALVTKSSLEDYVKYEQTNNELVEFDFFSNKETVHQLT